MREMRFVKWLLFAITLLPCAMWAQEPSSGDRGAEIRLRIVPSQPERHPAAPAAIWLEPLAGTPPAPFVPHERYTLLQKNRMFIPHLQVIPVGSIVEFPNADPFFHNVFSLFDGNRFDLGLYKAGSSKSVTFPREGVSYIFCNIHPEMSAVVLTLSTSLYAIANAKDSFVLANIPPGTYKLHIWIEGVPASVLDGLSRTVHLSSRKVDLGQLIVPKVGTGTMTHTNKFGKVYSHDSNSIY